MTTTPMEPISNKPLVKLDPPDRRPARQVDVSPQFVALANRIVSLRTVDADLGRTAKAVGFTSCTRKGGATTTAANVAIASTTAVPGEVLLIETQPRRRSRGMGWSELIRGQAELSEILIESDVDGLVRIPGGTHAGPAVVDPARVRAIMGRLKERFEWIFVDLPQANELSGCYPIASVLDGVLLVVHANRVCGSQANRVAAELEQAGAQLVGVVLNRKKKHVPAFLRRLLPFLAEPE